MYVAFSDYLGLPRWLIGKESASNERDSRKAGLIPGSGRFPGVGNDNHSSILAWKIPLIEESGSYILWGNKESNKTEHITHTHAHTHTHTHTLITYITAKCFLSFSCYLDTSSLSYVTESKGI